MKILLCAATGQNPVNVLPLESEHIKPDVIYVAITEGMKGQGESLIQELKSIGKKVERLDIKNEHSLQALTTQYEDWLLKHQNDEVIVNLTGGTKPMSIAAYQLFSGYGFRCFYQNLNPNHIIWLDDESTISNIGEKIGLERYLKSYHFEVVKKQKLADVPKAYKDYADILFYELCRAGYYDQTCNLISRLNAHASENRNIDLKKFDLTDEHALLTHLSRETGVFELKGHTIKWQSEQDRAFIAGGWLEVLAADLLRGNDFRDIYLSVEIAKSTQRIGAKTFQEIDVMAMQKQKLMMIECKTVNWKNTADASEAIYKLSALSHIGLNTKPIFISLYDISSDAKTRAAEHDIYVIAGKTAITHIKQQLASL